MKNSNDGKLIYQETYPYIKFIVEEISKESLDKLVELLKSKYAVYKKELSFKDKEKTKQILVLKDSQIVGAVNLEELSKLTDISFVNVTVFYNPSDEGEKFKEKIKDFFKEKSISEKHIRFLFFNSFSASVDFLVSGKSLVESINPDLFYGINADKLTKAFLTSSQNLLILYGKPGTGKSKLIQYIIGKSLEILNKRMKILVIKGFENIKSSADSIEIYLTNDLVIFDDFDCPSFKRGEDDKISDIVSTILSATDGFIPKRPKIIISTNVHFREIDPALTRPSRLFDILEIKPLPKEFFLKLTKKYPELSAAKPLYEKEDEIEVAKIYDFISRNRSRIDYLKDESISKKNAITNRKVGF